MNVVNTELGDSVFWGCYLLDLFGYSFMILKLEFTDGRVLMELWYAGVDGLGLGLILHHRSLGK